MPSESLFTKCKSCGRSVSVSAFKCPECGKILKKPSLIHWLGIIFVGLIVIGMVNAPDSPKTREKEVVSPEIVKQKMMNKIELDYEWRKEGFGSVMEADLRIKNNNPSDIKDIEIQCDHFAKSGTKIDSNNRTIYEIFHANSSKKFMNFNMGFIRDQINSTSCYIKNFSIVNT